MTTLALKLGIAARNAVKNTIQTYINAALDNVYTTWQDASTLQTGVSVGASSFVSMTDLGANGAGEAQFDGGNASVEIVQVNFASRSGTAPGPFTYNLATGTTFKIAHQASAPITSEPYIGTIIPKAYPQAVYNGMRNPIPSYPAIVVSSIRGQQKENAAPYWARVEHHIDVTIGIVGDDAFVLDQEIDRYLAAIWQILMEHQALDGSLSGHAGTDILGYGKSGAYRQNEKSPLLTHLAGWEVVVQVDDVV